MNDFNDEQFGKFVRDAITPTGDQDLKRDLWPHMLLKLRPPVIRVSWFDWVLAAVVVVLCLMIPESAEALLLHL
jgi:hypothetical protein